MEWIYKIGIERMLNEIQGFFAICICEVYNKSVKVTLARDSAGARPLYISQSDKKGEFVFCSELKGSPFLNSHNITKQLPSGCYATISSDGSLGSLGSLNVYRYFDVNNIPVTIFDDVTAQKVIYETFTEIVKDLCKSDRIVGFALSGGFDSSAVVCAKASLFPDQPTYTFTIGEEGSTDIHYAEIVAKFHGTVHKTFIIPKSFCLKIQSLVIKTVESYDTTTVRASTWQLLLMLCTSLYCGVDLTIDEEDQYLIDDLRKIIGPCQNIDMRVINIGDGSDEVAGGYISFKKCKTSEEFDMASKQMFRDIYQFDGQRADRCTSNGLECNSPYLDRRFIEMYFSIDPALRMPRNGVEKWLLRSAFIESKIMPEEIRMRKKEALSDGVSPESDSWYVTSAENASKLISDDEFSTVSKEYSHCPPSTKESFLYRKIFRQHFGDYVDNVIPYYWKHIGTSDGSDPSARTLDYYY